MDKYIKNLDKNEKIKLFLLLIVCNKRYKECINEESDVLIFNSYIECIKAKNALNGSIILLNNKYNLYITLIILNIMLIFIFLSI